jgi:hypothetical protein
MGEREVGRMVGIEAKRGTKRGVERGAGRGKVVGIGAGRKVVGGCC